MDITQPGGVDASATAAPVRIPDFIAEVIERVAFEARNDQRIDKRSGVSQRMPISVMENVVSNAERRAIVSGDARGRAAHLRHLRGAPGDHRQDRARVRGRAGRRPGDRARADPPRRGRDVPGSRGRRERRRHHHVVRRGRRAAGGRRRASGAMVKGSRRRPGAHRSHRHAGLADEDDAATVGRGVRARARSAGRAQEDLALRSGRYGRAAPPERRRPPPEF